MKINSIKNIVKMKSVLCKGLLSALLLTSAVAHSSGEGLYIGGQLVYIKDSPIQSASSEKALFSDYKPNGSSKFAVGFQFNDRGAFEIGYFQLNQSLPQGWMSSTPSSTEKYHIKAVNVAAKSILPLDQARSVYAKLGGAYILNFSKVDSQALSGLAPIEKQEKVSLTFSVGGSAEITEKLKIDISWNWIFTPSLLLPSITDPVNFLAIGASFHLN